MTGSLGSTPGPAAKESRHPPLARGASWAGPPAGAEGRASIGKFPAEAEAQVAGGARGPLQAGAWKAGGARGPEAAGSRQGGGTGDRAAGGARADRAESRGHAD